MRNFVVQSGGALALLLGWPTLAEAAAGESLGAVLPGWSVLPFAGILLSVALGPMVSVHKWEEHMGKVSLLWALLFIVPFWAACGAEKAAYHVLHMYALDYIPFLVLLTGLFVVAGGIHVRGVLKATPWLNGGLLALGALLANLIGTTGASMLLVRPLLRANLYRLNQVHTMIFFIFLVGNIGGSLTPVGDPPLFLGFLHGVPFFWTLKLLPLFALNVGALLAVYVLLDWHLLRREKLLRDMEELAAAGEREPLRLEGLHNIWYLLGIVLAVIGSGVLSSHPWFLTAGGEAAGFVLWRHEGQALVVPWLNVLRDGAILSLAALSWRTTPRRLREANYFTWGPIREVAVLFAGIFATIIPALALLQARGGELGVQSPAQFFWATGLLSGFLDNAPTYLAFLSLAGGLEAGGGIGTDLGMVPEATLLAISAGAVFMGAMTYIGNAPNFMVRSIAVENGVEMPGFFKYMLWSLFLLVPLYLLDTYLFF